MIRSSRRVPKGKETSNSVTWRQYSAAIWALMVRSCGWWLSTTLQQKRCNNSKTRLVPQSGNRDGDSSPCLGCRCWGAPPSHTPREDHNQLSACELPAEPTFLNLSLIRMYQAGKKCCREFNHSIPSQMIKQQAKARGRRASGDRPQTGGERMLAAGLHPGLGFRKFSLYSGKTERRFSAVLSSIYLKV